jgi:predicted nuclease of predicted toxin-antitoxin system
VKLRFDHNLSRRLVLRLADLFPDSTQTGLVGLATAEDARVWEFARVSGCCIVTLDSDFADLAVARGAPPKVLWLRCGNSTVAEIERLLRSNVADIRVFGADPSLRCLEIWD